MKAFQKLMGAACIGLALGFLKPADAQVYVEQFDGRLPSVVLNGAVELGVEGNWSTRITDGALELSNNEADDAIRYITLPSVVYPGTTTVARTDGATIEVAVRVTGEDRSGAGIVAGFDSRTKDYILLGVGMNRTFYAIVRRNGAARFLAAGEHEAIRDHGINRLRVHATGSEFVFEVNGTEIIRVPESEATGRSIGIAAFGRGSFQFDEVRISPASALRPLPRRTVRPPTASPPQVGCRLPAVGPDEQIVVYGTYEGAAIPTVTIAGQNEDSTLTTLEIEPGDRPLYIIVTSYDAMISRVVGEAERVAKLVLIPRQTAVNGEPAAGATGLPPEKVTFAHSATCIRYFYEAGSIEGIQARAAITRILGREPDVFVGAYEAQSVSLPSGNVEKADRRGTQVPEGFDKDVWQEAVRFYPAGIVSLDPAEVVSSAPVEAYGVLPSQVGLAQLVGSGAVEAIPGGGFKIVRPIPRFPAGLSGAHSVRFVLGQGVPYPGGSPGHSCVISEETGLDLNQGPLCR